MNKKKEGNLIIIIDAAKKIMSIFLGPFLTAYFIKKSTESIVDLSIYYIFSDILLVLGTFIVACIIKNKFKIGMFRIGVFFNFIYIMSIIILKEKIIDYLWLISILYGISASAYWFPYNMFIINKIDNSYRTEYTVKSKIVSSAVGILCPIILGSIITVTNYELTAFVILFVSLIQVIVSFMLKPDDDTNLPKIDYRKTWNKLKNNNQIKNMFKAEFLVGLNVSDGALETVMTILIFNSFKTNMNLGIVSSISTVLSMIVVHLYGKKYKNKSDNKIIIISSIIPVISLLILLFMQNNITVILYNFCYVIFAGLLSMAREIRLYNLSDSYIVNKENQAEFLAIREVVLNGGRVTGYLMLLVAGITKSKLLLNIVMIILTLSILAMGIYTKKIEKFEEK